MIDLIPKVLKWLVSALFFILAMKMLNLTMNGASWSLIIAIFSFGIIYWQYTSKSAMGKPVMLASIGVLICTAAAALYLPAWLPFFPSGFFPFNGGFFMDWGGLTVLLGGPVMAWVFDKYD